MKRRIIAALTALVMVVTMIPASAFAATSVTTGEQLNALIANTISLSSGDTVGTVKYDQKTSVNDLVSKYVNLSAGEKENVDVNKLNALYAAQKAFNAVDDAKATFDEALAKVVAGSIDKTSGAFADGIAKDLNSAYTSFGSRTGLYEGVSVTVSIDAKEKTAMLGEKNEELAKKLVSPSTLETAVGNINNCFKAVTSDVIKSINAANYNTTESRVNQTVANYNVIKAALGTGDADYLYVAKYYADYLKVAEKVEEFVALQKDFKEINTVLSANDTIAKVKTTAAKGAEDLKKLTDALAKAKTYVDKYGVKMDVDFTGSDVSYATLKTNYEAAQKAYDGYGKIDATTTAIKSLPSVKAVEEADYDTLMAYFAEYSKIDAKVAAETTVYDVYQAVGNKINARLADYADKNAVLYANKLNEAIKALPEKSTRADVEKYNAALNVVIEYVKATGKDASAFEAKILDKNYTKLTASDFSAYTALTTELNKLDKNALPRLIAASEMIVDQYNKDQEAVEKVLVTEKYNVPSIMDEVIAADKTGAEAVKALIPAAKAAIEQFNTNYAALNEYAKADFDKKVADKVGEYATIHQKIADVEAIIAKYTMTDEDILQAIAVGAKLTALTNKAEYPVADIKPGTETYAKVSALVKEIEKDFENAKILEYCKTNYASEYAYFETVQDKLKESATASDAAKNTMKAIDALKVIDDEKEVLTQAEVDAVIESYNSVVKMYDALTSTEKSFVTNYSVMSKVEAGIVAELKDVFELKVESIGNTTAALTDSQIDIINSLTAMTKNETYLAFGDTIFTALNVYGPDSKVGTYQYALKKLNAEIADEAMKEWLEVKPYVDAAKVFYNGAAVTATKDNARAIIKAVDVVNGLSDAAKELPVVKSLLTSDDAYKAIANAYVSAKELVLDYATVVVEDVEFDGTAAMPKVVVKNASGVVVAETEYVVSYSNNDKPGTAKVIVTAAADGKLTGTIEKEFKVIGKDLAKVENVKFDTDYGIVRVYFDRTADIDGVDVRYQVQYKKTTSDTWTTKYPTKGLDYLTLKNLTKNGKYDVRVRAYTDDYGTERVYGEYSDVQTVYANRNGAKSGIMYKAVIKSLTTKNGSVTMTVNPVKYQTVPQGVTWKYSYKKYGSQYTTWSTAKTTKNTSYTFKNLKKGTRYVFRAQYTYTSAVDGKTAVNSNYSVYKNIVVK